MSDSMPKPNSPYGKWIKCPNCKEPYLVEIYDEFYDFTIDCHCGEKINLANKKEK